ncbi:hypothetical protein E4U36_008388, partial [Claviceps purpurea]
ALTVQRAEDRCAIANLCLRTFATMGTGVQIGVRTSNNTWGRTTSEAGVQLHTMGDEMVVYLLRDGLPSLVYVI